jgi:hypothetical protein
MKRTIVYLLLLLAAFEAQAQTLIATSHLQGATANHNQRKIVRDTSDNAYVVFADSTEQGKIIKGLWLNRKTGQWSEPATIMPGTNPSLAIDKNNKFSLVFESDDSLKGIYYTSSTDFSTWVLARKLSEEGCNNQLPVCDSDSSGRINVLWKKDLGDSGQSLQYACVVKNTLTTRKTVMTKPVINDVAIAGHLQNLGDDFVFSLQFATDSILFFRTADNMESFDTLYKAKGSQPCATFNSHYPVANLDENATRLLYTDENKKLIEFEYDIYDLIVETGSKTASSKTTDYVCIDDLVSPLGYSFLFMQNDTLYHGFSYATWSKISILDTITGSPINPAIAYKTFSSGYIDFVWMQKNGDAFDIYYKRDEKINSLHGGSSHDISEGLSVTGYPNPFTTQLTINVDVKNSTSEPVVEIFNSNFVLVAVLGYSSKQSKRYTYMWDAQSLNSASRTAGLYFIRCTVGKERIAKKVVHIK